MLQVYKACRHVEIKVAIQCNEKTDENIGFLYYIAASMFVCMYV